MAGKQIKKVLRAWKRFTRRITRGGVPMQSPRHMPAGPPPLIRRHAMIHPPPQPVNNNNEFVPRQHLNFGHAPPQHLNVEQAHPRRHTYHRTQPRTYRSLSPRTNTTQKRPHH